MENGARDQIIEPFPETTGELSTAGNLELKRRMLLAQACAAGCGKVVPKLADAKERWEITKKSTLSGWAIAIAIGAYLAGLYIWSGFYGIAVWAGAALLGHYVDEYGQRNEVDRQTRELDRLEVLWFTGGHSGSEFASLLGIIRAEHPHYWQHSEQYEKWHTEVFRFAKRDVLWAQQSA